jgi:hypothetical protein
MLIGFIIGLLTMYFIINLYFSCVAFNNTPTQFPEVKKLAWMGFAIDLIIGIWLRGIMYKIEVLARWNIIMKNHIEKSREKVDAEK